MDDGTKVFVLFYNNSDGYTYSCSNFCGVFSTEALASLAEQTLKAHKSDGFLTYPVDEYCNFSIHPFAPNTIVDF